MENHFPENWSLLPLADCMEAIIDYRGKTPRKSPFGIPLITAKIVKDGRIHEPNEFIPVEDYDERMQRGIPQAGDIVVTTEAPLGEVGQLDGRKLSVGQRLITLRGKDGLLDNTYLKFLMMSEYIQNQLVARATGTTVIGIKQKELRKISLAIPPLQEQRAIAGILGALDDKIEINRRMNRTLESMARAVFRQWFVEGEQVNQWDELTWGEIATLEYGKSLSGYKDSNAPYVVYGTNGAIGMHTEPLYQSEGIIIGRKGAYRGIHYSPYPFFVIDTAFYIKPQKPFSMKWAYYELLRFDLNSMDSGSAIPSTAERTSITFQFYFRRKNS